jgi:organic hydroperoxide reductase OsmC/OhrA
LIDLAATVCGALVRTLYEQHARTQSDFDLEARGAEFSYQNEAVGHIEKNAKGKMAITRVELRPKITWVGDRTPSAEQLDEMHHAAHENCFIANSVTTEVFVTKL